MKGKCLCEKQKLRKIEYLLLFMVLHLVEWLKGTQPGDIWKVAVNVSGLTVLVLIMTGYQKAELGGRFCKAVMILGVLVSLGMLGFDVWYEGYFPQWQYVTAAWNVVLILIIGRALWKRYRQGKLPAVRRNLSLAMWVFTTVLMVLSVSGRLWPTWYLVIYGMFFLTEYSGEDKEAILESMVDGAILSFFLMQAYALGFRPYDEVRYKGPLSNCNMTALYYLIIYAMVLVKLHFLHLQKAKKLWKACYLVLAGVLLGLMFMTLCRTAWMSAGLMTLIYGIFVMKEIWNNKISQILGKAVLLGAVTLAVFPLVFYSVRWLPTILHHPVWYEGEWDEDKVHSFDPADSEKYVSMEEFLENAVGRFAQIFLGADADGLEKESVKKKDKGEQNWTEPPRLTGKDEYTSGEIRAVLFQAYWDDLNLKGHTEKEGYYQITEDYTSWHAQNLWLQIAYYFGIPAGIASIVLTAVVLWDYFWKSRKGKLHIKYGVLPLLILALYFSFGVMEVVWNPGQLIFCLVFLVQHPGMVRNRERN